MNAQLRGRKVDPTRGGAEIASSSHVNQDRRAGRRDRRARLVAAFVVAVPPQNMPQYDPQPGHKIQHAPNVFTVNDYECLVLDTHAWPSERVHCELQSDGSWLWVVEHIDDAECRVPNAELPVITHGTDCFYFSTNHSYRDTCNENRTATVSAWHGPGCIEPMALTATNLEISPALPPAADAPATVFAVAIVCSFFSSLLTAWVVRRTAGATRDAGETEILQQQVSSTSSSALA